MKWTYICFHKNSWCPNIYTGYVYWLYTDNAHSDSTQFKFNIILNFLVINLLKLSNRTTVPYIQNEHLHSILVDGEKLFYFFLL